MSRQNFVPVMLATEHYNYKRHDGHEEKAEGYFSRNNQIVKITFWVVVVLVVVLLAVQRFVLWRMRKQRVRELRESMERGCGDGGVVGRKRGSSSLSSPAASRTTTRAVSILRAMGCPRLVSVGRYSRYVTVPSRGQAMFLALYWAMLMILLWTNVIFKSPSEVFGIQWEVVGFRAAWVSTIQLPLLYCTGCRINPISIITGISHERMNWFHRWVARTMFTTLIVHWAFFYREWDIAHFVRDEFEMMPMVIWGFAAWAAMGVMVITSFGFFRAWYYELWIASHIVMAYAVLILSYTHTHCTTYFVEASLGFIAFDMLGRLCLYTTKNIHFLRRGAGWLPELGHCAELEILDHEYLQVSISNPGFNWSPGQHAYLYIPQVRALESHPFTISSVPSTNSSTESGSRSNGKMVFVIKAHAGFTGALYRSALGAEVTSMRALVQGPYGNPPPLSHYDTVVLIASGNRASFTVPLLQTLSANPGRVSRISFHLAIPDEQMLRWYTPQLQQSIESTTTHNIQLEIVVHITKRISHPQKIQLDDVEMWPDDNYSIGGDSSDDARSSISAYAPVPTDQDDENARLINGTEAPARIEKERASSTLPGTTETVLDRVNDDEPSSSLVDTEKHDDLDTAHNTHDEESAALLPPSSTAPMSTRDDLEKNQTIATNTTNTENMLPGHQKTSLTNQARPIHNPSLHSHSHIRILTGRPTASSMITPALEHTLPQKQNQVMVVAATTPGLLDDITTFVARTALEIGVGKRGIAGIELWSERNGD